MRSRIPGGRDCGHLNVRVMKVKDWRADVRLVLCLSIVVIANVPYLLLYVSLLVPSLLDEELLLLGYGREARRAGTGGQELIDSETTGP